jgi:ATP-dependent RNA helicase DeaD
MSDIPNFDALNLIAPVLEAVREQGYETPSAIQAESIPPILAGKDILGQAQTGTGKTAAFALPLLSRIDVNQHLPQVLVLTPTRELAIQVADAFKTYAKHLQGVNILPIYGGQSYDIQLRQLKRGVQVVVGTPGRVMDHIRRKTLKLENLKALVLDEADEMLRMGFIDDVEWVLEHTPDQHQTALFSATMPPAIKKVSNKYLNNPVHIKITGKTTTAKTIHQRYIQVNGYHKLDALTRILEMEKFDAMLVFVRTKNNTVELAEKLSQRGYAAEALNGDIPQNQRERIVDRLKKGKLDILIATDVVARGLDVQRISHVMNYDIPHDTESYVHRIGRTGRAGREGDAILFLTPRERYMLRSIERATNQQISRMELPSVDDINALRIQSFKQKITETLASPEIEFYQKLINDYQTETDFDPSNIAAALALITQGKTPFLLTEVQQRTKRERQNNRDPRSDNRDRGGRGNDRGNDRRPNNRSDKKVIMDAQPLKDHPAIDMVRYRLDVGRNDKVKPGNIVGAIANEAGLESKYIGSIEIYDAFSTIDLPDGMPPEVFQSLENTRICGRKANLGVLSSYAGDYATTEDKYTKEPQKRKFNKGQGRGGKRHNNRKR